MEEEMDNKKYPWHSAHTAELTKVQRDRYALLRKQGLCVWCGKEKATTRIDGHKAIKYCEGCRVNYNLQRSRQREELKREVLAHYGPNGVLKCSWEDCEVCDVDMLSLDHIENDGNTDRNITAKVKGKTSHSGGITFYAALKREGYPEGLQTLCHNHQWKKEILRRRRDLNGTPSWKK